MFHLSAFIKSKAHGLQCYAHHNTEGEQLFFQQDILMYDRFLFKKVFSFSSLYAIPQFVYVNTYKHVCFLCVNCLHVVHSN